MRGETIIQGEPLETVVFQSTPLMRGETCAFARHTLIPCHFNPLPSCEGRLFTKRFTVAVLPISIHSPHARGDLLDVVIVSTGFEFQSTPLMRGETRCASYALIAGVFQSTPLMRGETLLSALFALSSAFQSTPLMRGETR